MIISLLIEHNKTNNIMKAVWNNHVLAESDNTVEVEGNQYFPKDSVNMEYFEDSPNRSECPWKGSAYYYHITINGNTNENAAWYYPDPKPAASEIKNKVAFWKGVVIEN